MADRDPERTPERMRRLDLYREWERRRSLPYALPFQIGGPGNLSEPTVEMMFCIQDEGIARNREGDSFRAKVDDIVSQKDRVRAREALSSSTVAYLNGRLSWESYRRLESLAHDTPLGPVTPPLPAIDDLDDGDGGFCAISAIILLGMLFGLAVLLLLT